MMNSVLQEIFRQAELYTDKKDYVMIKLHPRAITLAAGIIAEIGDPFAALLVDKNEVSLVIPAELCEEFPSRIPADAISTDRYRLITFDLELAPDLIGFMAAISAALAEAGVSILPLAAASRDHVLVPTQQFETAWSALEKLRAQG